MDRALVVRAAALYVPLCATAIAWLALRPSHRERAAAILATAWHVPALLGLHIAARKLGWWRYDVTDATIAGFPVDLYLGWAVAWGALASLLGRTLPVGALCILVAIVDVVAMPRLSPVVRLGETWIVGEAVAIAACLVPAQLLARWTREDSHVRRRVVLQAVAFGGLALGVLPAVILQQSGGSWSALVTRSSLLTSTLLQLLLLPALLGLAATQEFAVRGGGTPVPFDAPKRLVTTGPYAFVRNPMQLSAALVMAGWGGILESWWVAGAAAMAVVYGSGFAAGDERGDLDRRFGGSWRAYRRAVRSWIPRWRPVDAQTIAGCDQSADVVATNRRGIPTLYVAEQCGSCSQVRAWLEARQPVGLAIVAAELHPSRSLSRITYDPGDGTGESVGVAALGRAMEHVNLAWALVGMFVRLPGVCWLLQILTDASGGGPTRVVRYCERPVFERSTP
jgi:protein-S-isoprenylcysteine O-methyltransferase Ste14